MIILPPLHTPALIHYIFSILSSFIPILHFSQIVHFISWFSDFLNSSMLRFPARPIFSSGTNSVLSRGSDKSKFERFFHPGASVVASMYSPASFPPSPVLMFKSPERPVEGEDDGH